MPRNRSARLAILGSAAQRSQTAPGSSRSTNPLKRRIVVAALVIFSLLLITVYFRESSGGALHGAQSAGATVLRPFEVASERVARPFRDGYGYVSGLVDAKSQLEKVKRENAALRIAVAQNAAQASQYPVVHRLLHYRDGPNFPADYRSVATSVLSMPPPAFNRQLIIDAGRKDGVRLWSPVTNEDGLIGQVTEVSRDTSQVTLLVDPTSNVAAHDASTRPGATGLVRHVGTGDQLILDLVQKTFDVRVGDVIETAGSAQGKLPSVYPAHIPIGRVTGVSQNDVDIYKQIQVAPYVDFSSLEGVIVLVPKHPTPSIP
jgi:rod shape-determining protein MreC